jgi:uncharacterized protein
MRTLSRSVPAPAHLGVEVLGVTEGSALELDLRLESVVEGVLVSGTVSGTMSGECVRCLDPVTAPLVVDLQELYAFPGTRNGPDRQEHPEDDDTEPLPEMQGDLIDLEPALRDAVVLALPLRPLCRDDCPGLCPQCGARFEEEPDHTHDAVDPRWAALRDIAPSEADRTT